MRRRSRHSHCTPNQAVRLVKGSRTLPSITSWMDVKRTTDSLMRMIKEQNWQDLSSQGGALRLAKSEGRIAEPATCRTEAW